MARARFNVLVIPYRFREGGFEYAVFHRPSDELPAMWQFVAGGGEGDETPAATAKREALEEAGIASGAEWMTLDSLASVPRKAFPGAPWPDDVYVIPEYCFAVDVGTAGIELSLEHDRFEWLRYDVAHKRLTWDSSRVALWELQSRLSRIADENY
jgi:dATP pyrophosphohydrolase